MAIGFGRSGLLEDFNALNVITVIAALTAGSAFLMWIGERITENGVGNGISIVLTINIISRMPSDLSSLYQQFVKGKAVAVGALAAVIILAIIVFIILTRTTFGYQLKACGSNRFAARYAGIKDKRNIVLSMAIAGSLAGAAGSLYYLSGNTEFFWSTYQSLPAAGFNGIPVALLAANHPIGVIFTGMFMSMLDIAGLQMTNLTAYNEYITDVIIAVIVYLSAFSLLIKTLLGHHRAHKTEAPLKDPGPDDSDSKAEGKEAAKA